MTKIEIIDNRFRGMMPGNALLETLGEGFRWLEGPVWFADHNCLYVSDIPNDRVLRWSEHDGISLFLSPSGFANGHARDREGRLLSCLHVSRCITRRELDGSTTVLIDRVMGKRLNAPNDLICKSDGTIWFTDPTYGIETDFEGGKQASERRPALYRFDPGSGDVIVVADDFEGPNGLAFSPDESFLYVSETGNQFAAVPRRCIRRFRVGDDGRLHGGDIFHEVAPGNADGFCVDQQGNLWLGAGDGVHCVAPDGTTIGKIYTPTAVSNLTFGDRYRSRLFMCAGQQLLAIFTNVRGSVWP